MISLNVFMFISLMSVLSSVIATQDNYSIYHGLSQELLRIIFRHE